MMVHDTRVPMLERVEPTRVQEYAQAQGWKRNRRAKGPLAVYKHPDVPDADLLVPLEPTYRDYVRTLSDAVALLAETAKRAPNDLVLDLLMPPADILRFSVSGEDIGPGNAPLTTAIAMLEGCRKALLAATLDVVRRSRRFHPRLSGTDADRMLASSRVATEAGSFVAALICPLDQDQGGQRDLGLEPPFGRLVTSHMVRSAQRMAQSVRDGRPQDLEAASEGEPAISANLIEALLEIQPPTHGARLTIRPTWEPSYPASNLPEQVELRDEYRRSLERVATRLRPDIGPASTTMLVGKIVKAEREADADSHAQGEVEVSFVDNDEARRAEFLLDGADFQKACDALRDDYYVAVEGFLERRARQPYRLDDVTRFQVFIPSG